MTQINLLPWRENKRQLEKKRFTAQFIACVVMALFTVYLTNKCSYRFVNNQYLRNKILQKEISNMDNQLKEIKNLAMNREKLISRMSIMQNLQMTRTLIVHLFDELTKVMPLGVYLIKMEEHNKVISITGYAESNTYISILMKNIENNKWLHHPALSEIKRADNQQAADNEFKLTFMLGSRSQQRLIS